MDKASALKTVAMGSISDRVKQKTLLKLNSQLPCLAFGIERESVKPPLCVVDS